MNTCTTSCYNSQFVGQTTRAHLVVYPYLFLTGSITRPQTYFNKAVDFDKGAWLFIDRLTYIAKEAGLGNKDVVHVYFLCSKKKVPNLVGSKGRNAGFSNHIARIFVK